MRQENLKLNAREKSPTIKPKHPPIYWWLK